MPHDVTSWAEAKDRCSQTNQPIYKKNFWESPHCPLTLSESHNALWSALVPSKSMHMPHPAPIPSGVPCSPARLPSQKQECSFAPRIVHSLQMLGLVNQQASQFCPF